MTLLMIAGMMIAVGAITRLKTAPLVLRLSFGRPTLPNLAAGTAMRPSP